MSAGVEKELCVTVRRYRCGDEKGMIDCIRDEYGDTYAKETWYSAIMESAEKGRDIFIVAQLPSGEIAGTTALVRTEGKTCTVYEIAAQVVKKSTEGTKLRKGSLNMD